jgi:hypothetical protein
VEQTKAIFRVKRGRGFRGGPGEVVFGSRGVGEGRRERWEIENDSEKGDAREMGEMEVDQQDVRFLGVKDRRRGKRLKAVIWGAGADADVRVVRWGSVG